MNTDGGLSPDLQRRLDTLMADYLRAVATGMPVDREALLARHPELAGHLRSFFAAQDEAPQAGPAAHTGAATQPPGGEASPDETAQAETLLSNETLTSPAEARNAWAGARIRYFGDYELVEEIARGGMGVVYKARQLSLNRIVALKMILAGQLASDDDVRRFYTEAEAAANLDHPGIVPIHEVGQHGGLHFYSMGFVEGQSLLARLAAGPLPPREAAELVVKVAEAIAYAHERGVIHRDLKPGNILLDRNGQPRVTDFGLAKRVQGDSGLTATGQVLGTPSYMSPEQAAGKTGEVGPLADVYALGAVLYALVSGRPPFQSAHVVDTLRAVLEQEPVPPRQLSAGVPVDLESICLKCLEKAPKRRYASASELARDLERYLRGEPVIARPVGRMVRAARWVARHPAAAGAYGFAALAVVALALGSLFTWLWMDAKQARGVAESALASETAAKHELASANEELSDAKRKLEQANDQLTGANQELTVAKGELEQTNTQLLGTNKQLTEAKVKLDQAYEKLDRIAYAERLVLAQREFEAGDVLRARRRLEECDAKYRGWEWGHLHLRFHEHELATLAGHTAKVLHVAFSPDGTRLASASQDGTVRLWDALGGKLLATLPGHDRTFEYPIAFSPDGARLATANVRTVLIWDARDGKPLATLSGHTSVMTELAFSPDGTRLASANLDKTVRLWDVVEGKPLATLTGHKSFVLHVVFSPDGTRLASAGDTTVHLWDARDGKALDTLGGHSFLVRKVAFSPDGTRLAAAGEARDKTLRLWDAREGKSLATLEGHAGRVFEVAFSPDGTRLATAGADKTLRLWDARDGKPLATLKGHTDIVLHLAFSPDGARLASAGYDNTVRLWDGRDGKPLATLTGHTDRVGEVAFSADGMRLASASEDKTVRLWEVREGKPQATLVGHTNQVFHAAFSPDGTRLASGSWDWSVRLWDASIGKPLATLPGHSGFVRHVAYSPDGTRLASASEDQTLRLWDARNGKLLATLPGHVGAVWHVAFSPDGTRLASSGYGDRTVRLWDARDGLPLAVLEGHEGNATFAIFSPDGTRLASCGHDTIVRLWDARTGKSLATLEGHSGGVRHVAFSPDGSRLASASIDKTVRLWDARDGKPLATLKGHVGDVNHVAFSPDGQRLASAGGSPSWTIGHTVRLWDAREGTLLAELEGHTDSVNHVAFSPDGTRLASASYDKTVRVWDAREGKPLTRLDGHTGNVYGVAFSPDGTRLASASLDKTVRLWFSTDTPERLAYRRQVWRQREAEEAEASGEWFAAAFHLAQLLDGEPQNKSFQARWDRAIEELTKTDQGLAERLAAKRKKAAKAPSPIE